jgi:ParB family transcriptional regulator, chromosome partitioning protein
MSGAPPTNEPQYWLDTWPTVIWDQELSTITPAKYNPRFLSDEAFERLRASIARFGMIKPIILNLDGTILAGHQRTKALKSLGAEVVPAMQLAHHAGTDDEVQFNLQHNSVEESDCEVTVPAHDEVGYRWIRHQDIKVESLGRSAARVGVTVGMIAKHGPWGSSVVNADGKVIVNSDYAAACKKARVPLLVHYNAADAPDVQDVLRGDFGIYDPSQAALTPFVQTMLQRFRLRYPRGQKTHWRDKSDGSFRSSTWEKYCLPWLTPQHKVLDFGAGRADYSRHLIADGYDVMYYEPFFIAVDEVTRQKLGDGNRMFDVAAIAKMILALEQRVRTGELYDVIILDSVINATSTEEFQRCIFATIASLLKPDGTLIMGTLGYKSVTGYDGTSRRTSSSTLGYVGKDLRGVSYEQGVMYAVKYHTKETLAEALAPHFGQVKIADGAQVHAVCSAPKVTNYEDLIHVLKTEFDMEYPGGYHHGVEGGLIEAILEHHYPDGPDGGLAQRSYGPRPANADVDQALARPVEEQEAQEAKDAQLAELRAQAEAAKATTEVASSSEGAQDTVETPA